MVVTNNKNREASTRGDSIVIDTTTLSDRVYIELREATVLGVQVSGRGLAWPTSAVLAPEVSIDGEEWVDHPTATDFTADGIQIVEDVIGYRYLSLRVHTITSAVSPAELRRWVAFFARNPYMRLS